MISIVLAQQLRSAMRAKNYVQAHEIVKTMLLRASVTSVTTLLKDCDRTLSPKQIEIILAQPDRLKELSVESKIVPKNDDVIGNINVTKTQKTALKSPTPTKKA